MIVHDYYAQVIARQRIEEGLRAAERAPVQGPRPPRGRRRLPQPGWQLPGWTHVHVPHLR